MRRLAATVVTVLALTQVSAADPFYGFFHYDEPKPPVAGDCGAIAAQIGPDATWHGEFSGRRHNGYSPGYFPFFASGCFESEFECRVWQNDATTYLGQGPIVYTTCRRGR